VSKITRILLVVFIILLAGCNRPQPEPKQLPTETPLAPQPVPTDTEIPPTQGNTPFPTFTPTDEPDQPRPPTEQPWQPPVGDGIPLFPAGTDITLHEIRMINSLQGWSIAVSDSDTEHVLRTEDGGYTWQDVTPPQPLAEIETKLIVNSAFWDEGTAWVVYNGSDIVWATRNGGVSWQAAPVEFETLYGGLFAILDEDHVWLFQFLEGGMQNVYTALNRTSDGGGNWEKLLDPYTDASIQSFDKTGAAFINPQYGWLTRNFRGVAMYVDLDVTMNGGVTWETLEMTPPPSLPDAFSTCACGLYDPDLVSPLEGSTRLSCACYENDQKIQRDYLYRTYDGGGTWEIQETPSGDLFYIDGQILYALGRDIHISEDGGESWQMVRTVNWDGQFSFIDRDTAWIVATNGEEYALVKTSNGCSSFIEIKPEVVSSTSTR
jgi:photosystem II stability/assembly factor-like uncharacterized protein